MSAASVIDFRSAYKAEESMLEICIELSEVHLISSFNNLYFWEVLSVRKFLFQKHISKHSIEAYKELCWEVEKTFEAVLPAPDRIKQLMYLSSAKDSFTLRIEKLQTDNLRLATELKHSEDQIASDTQ